MFNYSQAFSGFSVDDLDKARVFYGDTLGLAISDDHGAIRLHFNDSHTVYVYAKDNHAPADYTMLNFEVEDIDTAVTELKDKGVTFEKYPGFDMDEDGVARSGPGPMIAWFKDPAGNILSILQPPKV